MCSRSCARRASKKVVVNVHYLADALEAHLASREDGMEIVISDERELLLETGGGLVKAAPLIDADPFLALNSDNLWIDGPADTLKLLASHWDEARMDALLLLVPQARALNHKGMGDFHMDRAGRSAAASRATSRRSSSPASRSSPNGCSRDAPEGPFSTNILWDRAIEEGRCFGAVHQGLWFDVGTPAVDPADGSGARACLTPARVAGLHHPAASLLRRRARRRADRALRQGPVGSRADESSFPTIARCGRSPMRSCGRAAADCCCRGWSRSAIPSSTRGSAGRSSRSTMGIRCRRRSTRPSVSCGWPRSSAPRARRRGAAPRRAISRERSILADRGGRADASLGTPWPKLPSLRCIGKNRSTGAADLRELARDSSRARRDRPGRAPQPAASRGSPSDGRASRRAGFTVAAGITTAAPAVAALVARVARMPDGMVVLPGLWLANCLPGTNGMRSGRTRTGRGEATHPQFHLKLLLDRMGVAREEVQRWRWSGRRGIARGAQPRHRQRHGRAGLFAQMADAAPGRAPPERNSRCRAGRSGRRSAGDRARAARGAGDAGQDRRAGHARPATRPPRLGALRRWGIEADDSAGKPLSASRRAPCCWACRRRAEEFAPVPLLALLKHPLVAERRARLEWLDRSARSTSRCAARGRPPGSPGSSHFADEAAAMRAWSAVRRPRRGGSTGCFASPCRLPLRGDARRGGATLAGDRAWRGPDGRTAAELVAELETPRPPHRLRRGRRCRPAASTAARRSARCGRLTAVIRASSSGACSKPGFSTPT